MRRLEKAKVGLKGYRGEEELRVGTCKTCHMMEELHSPTFASSLLVAWAFMMP